MTLARTQALESLTFEGKSSIGQGKGTPKKPSLGDNATRVRERAVDPGSIRSDLGAWRQEIHAFDEPKRMLMPAVGVAFEPEESDWKGEVYLAYIPGRTAVI
jgi:hypothetical protein